MNSSKFLLKKITTLILMFGIVISIQAQNTLVMGKIKNAKLLRTIDLSVNKRYLTNTVDTYTSKIIDDNTFAFAIDISEPQLVTLNYARNQGLIYLEPNDTLYIDCDANNFQFSFEFSGKAAHHNSCFTQYLRTSPKSLNIFEFTNYRLKNYQFSNNPKMNKAMNSMDERTFVNHLSTRYHQGLSILEQYEKKNPNNLSENFKAFMEADVIYDRAYHMLMYGHVFKKIKNISPEYYVELEKIPLQNEQIGNEWYREYLVAYFDNMNLKAGVQNSDYTFEYDMASEKLTGKAKAFYQSEIIARAFRAKKQNLIIDRYMDYVAKSNFDIFDDKVLATYHRAMKFAGGTFAPDFVMEDINDNVVTLSSFVGKTVYLNFWATWCRPCMKKMSDLKTIQPELEQKNIVFINVSLDRTEEIWKETIEKKGFKGVHVLASGELNSEIARAYEITVLPQYFIINKQGQFVQDPKLTSVEDVKQILIETANK